MMQPNFFCEGSPFLQHPLLTTERTRKEIEFILEKAPLPTGSQILDIGCGFGRHSIELASRGFNVTGIDPSPAMIAAARDRAKKAGQQVTFQQATAKSFHASHQYDAAICLFTTLGQISAAGENRSLIDQAARLLRPGGIFIVEVPQREAAVRQLKPTEKFGEGNRYTAVTRRYDPSTKIVTEEFALVSPEATRTFLLQYRLYSREELLGLLAHAGFNVVDQFSDYTGSPLTGESPTMIVVTCK